MGKKSASKKSSVKKTDTKPRAGAGKKPAAASTKASASAATRPVASGPRRLKIAPYKSFRLQQKIKTPVNNKKILGSFRLFKRALLALTGHWKLFLGIIIIYALLSIVLAGGLSLAGNANLTQLKPTLSHNLGKFVTGLTLFASLAGNGASGGASQLVIGIIVSLALIWALRQVYIKDAGALRIRDSFYRGMGPLVPFILVLIVLLLELIPLAIGALLYSTVVTGGIASTGLETALFAFIFFLLAVASFHMLTSSVFALYIVTLDGMTPVKALKSAVILVRARRVKIFMKLLFLVVALIVIAAIITIPLALFVTSSAPYVFFLLTLVFLAIFHSYVYALYRELI